MKNDMNVTLDESTNELTLIVNPDHIIEAMRRNSRDFNTRRSHKLRFNRPLEGRIESSIEVIEEGNYWPYPENAPLTLDPMQFIEDNNWHGIAYPEWWQINECAMETDGVDDLDDVKDETIEECWDVYVEVWESNVRNHLKNDVDINGFECSSNAESQVVAVEYVDE